jgi:AcrR family transcriptional regulator
MSQPLPTEAQVRTAATELLNAAAAGSGRPTATALAAHLGISRPQLYRHYQPLVDELLDAAAASTRHARRGRIVCNHEEELARLRRANGELHHHVQVYEEIIRQLTVDNTRLRSQLDQHAGVVDLTARRHDPFT